MINLEFLPDLQHFLNSAKVEERKASSVNLDSVSMMIFLSATFYHFFSTSITFVLFLSESETAASSFGSSMSLSLVEVKIYSLYLVDFNLIFGTITV